MNRGHVISDEVLNDVMTALAKSHSWFVYNALSYLLGKGDVKFFKTENEADDWAFENNSKWEVYQTIHIDSVPSLFREIKYAEKLDTLLNHSKRFFMNQQNLDYLKENLRFLGFGDKLHADLEKNMRQAFPEFVLKMQSEFSGQKMDSILFFKKSDQSDHYFFNKHDAVLKNEVGTFEQSFYLNKGHGVTLKEAFNLLQGRAVYKEMENKEGQKFRAWIELDFKGKDNGNYKVKQYHDNYGYNLESTLKNFPIKELQNEQQKERLLSSLQRGNRQSVTMGVDGREQMFFLQANPQFKTITVFDKGATRPLTADQKSQLMVVALASKEKLNWQPSLGNDSPKGESIGDSKAMDRKPENKAQKDDVKKNQGESESINITVKRSETKGKKMGGDGVKGLLPQNEGSGPKKGLRA